MKKLLLSIYLITAYFLGFGQCPNLNENCESGKGIKTDPDNPENCKVSVDINGNTQQHLWRLNEFDWRLKNPNNSIEYYNTFVGQNNRLMNPFTGPSDALFFTQGYALKDVSNYLWKRVGNL